MVQFPTRKTNFLLFYSIQSDGSGFHPTFCSMGLFVTGKAACVWSWPITSVSCWSKELTEFYLHSPCIFMVSIQITWPVLCHYISPHTSKSNKMRHSEDAGFGTDTRLEQDTMWVLFSSKCPHRLWGPPVSYSGAPDGLLPVATRLSCAADYSSPFSARFENEWSQTSQSRIFTACSSSVCL